MQGDRPPLRKGRLRGRLSANGAKSYYQLHALGALLRPVLELDGVGERWRPKDAAGYLELDASAKAAVEEALS